MKIYISKINESWVVDRFRSEWIENNSDITSKYIYNADIIWIIAPWLWKKIPNKYLELKKVICTIHHLESSDLDEDGLTEFMQRDKFVDQYHVISKKTEAELKKITKKKITYIPFWLNNNIFYEITDKLELRNKYKIKNETFVVGSFQRDTEGKDLKSPKLIKGPDRLVKIFDDLSNKYPEFLVLLAGMRRQYIIEQLNKRQINFLYFEMVDFSKLNELYNLLDLYVIASRVEGGPAAVLECGITKTPVLSTNVGIASEILHPDSIFTMESFNKAKPDIDTAFKNSQELLIPKGFDKFKKMFLSLN